MDNKPDYISGIPVGVSRDDVFRAIKDFDDNVEHAFGPSIFYDLIYEDRRYPPKAILGLAARRLAGRVLGPNEFTGGERSRCFRVLRELDFEIAPKPNNESAQSRGTRIWTLSLGEGGRLFHDCYDNRIVAIGWSFLGDLREYPDRDAIYHALARERTTGVRPTNDALCAWQFANEMKIGDIVIAKIGRSKLLGCARIESGYEYNDTQPEYRSIRRVSWLSDTSCELPKRARIPTKTLTDVTGYRAFREFAESIYPEIAAGSGDASRALHESPTSNVWIELTKSSHDHGGEGWEFGTCLWSPSSASDGKDWYRLMRDAKPGDIVIHIEDSVFQGHSIVEKSYVETDAEPPKAGAWADMAPFYRVDLKSYEPFAKPLPVGSFIRDQKELIADELSGERPLRYPFQLEASGLIKTVQGGYLSKCTPRLYNAIRASVEPTGTSTPLPSYSIEEALDGVFMSQREFETILDCLTRKKNVVLQGPPGVGKTFLAKRLAYSLIGVKDPARIEMVQFHQSYSYEDFVQGWRPTNTGGFELRDGVFHGFCHAAQDGRDHVFIIDEINRGNLSRILGELMMLVEADKRGPEFAIPLTYSQDREERFFVPSNVYIIGLMNTADRSLAMVDYALRRRFSFIDLRPQYESARFRSFLIERGAEEGLLSSIIKKMTDLNAAIAGDTKNLGPGFAIGHSFFCPTSEDVVLDDEWFASVVNNEIAPLLREYWFDDPEHADTTVADLL